MLGTIRKSDVMGRFNTSLVLLKPMPYYGF